VPFFWQVNSHLQSTRSDPSGVKPSKEQLEELRQRAQNALTNYKASLPSQRLLLQQRAELRESAASSYLSLCGASSLDNLLRDRQLEACAKGQEKIGLEQGPEYAALVEQIAGKEHKALLAAIRGKVEGPPDRLRAS